MPAADRFLEAVVQSSGIPSDRRRREVLRELKTHVEDFVLEARTAGHAEEETDRLVLAHFGDPREVARQFAWVYRRERALWRAAAFVLSTAAGAGAIAAIVMTLKAGMALGFGIPLPRVFNPHHTTIEALDSLATAAAYVGLISLQRLFTGRRAAALLTALLALGAAALWVAGLRWQFLIFGLMCALFLRATELLLNNPGARLLAMLLCFGAIGSLSLQPVVIASWMITGLGYAAMTRLAARVDRALHGFDV